MANEATQDAAEPITPAAQDAPGASTPAPDQGQAAASASAGTSSGASTEGGSTAPAGHAAPPAGAPTTPPPGWRDHLKEAGIDLSGFRDEAAASQYLAQRLREAQQYVRYGQEVAPHYGEFQTWQRERQAAAQARAEAEKPWHSKFWSPPEYDPSWNQLVVQDPQTGEMKPAPGAPADVVQRLGNYRHFRAQQAEKFMSNPAEYIEPIVRHLAQEIADQTVQKHFGGFKEENAAQSFVQENSGWLYAQGAQGQKMTDPLTGQPMLSEWGQRFKRYAEEAGSVLGIQSVEGAKTYALMKVQLEHAQALLAQQQQTNPAAPPTPAVNPREAANAMVLGQTVRQRPAANNAVPPQQPVGQLSLQEKLRRNMRAAGITDEALAGR